MIPRDRGVVFTGKEVCVWHIGSDAIMHIADKSLIPSDSDGGGEKRFYHTVSHINPIDRTPLGGDIAVLDDDAAHGCPRFGGTHDAVVGFAHSKRCFQVRRGITVLGVLVGEGVVDGRVQASGVESKLRRGALLPNTARREIIFG